eukprot:scaffold10334_cov71-Phaeocystis_antarctica.AAC.9
MRQARYLLTCLHIWQRMPPRRPSFPDANRSTRKIAAPSCNLLQLHNGPTTCQPSGGGTEPCTTARQVGRTRERATPYVCSAPQPRRAARPTGARFWRSAVAPPLPPSRDRDR